MPYNYPCQIIGKHLATTPCPVCQAADSNTIIQGSWAGSTEPRLVYQLFFSGKAVNDWTAYMSQWRPSLLYAGVFLHQRPYCEFNPHPSPAVTPSGSYSRRCELADLLVVFTDKMAQRRVALLLQAKMASGVWPPTLPNPGQWDLYTTWPTFRYTPRPPTGTKAPQLCTLPFAGAQDPAAQYLELNANRSTAATTQAFTQASLNRWDYTIDHLLNGGAGRDFAYHKISVANDWDRLIWDLLTYTYSCAMSTSTSSGAGGTRGVGAFLTGRTVSDTTQGIGPSDGFPMGEGSDDPWGIPIIHFIREVAE